MTRIDFNAYAEAYARNRSVQPRLLERMVALLGARPSQRVLEVGCGTANYARAIARETGAELHGIDPHAGMIEQAASIGGAPGVHLAEGSAESIPYPDATFDALYSVDVIHHVENRSAYAAEAFRVLRSGAVFLTATDSGDDIRGRIPLSSHFPETVQYELARYPTLEEQVDTLADAGFVAIMTEHVAHAYDLNDMAPYEARAFSALRLIDDEAWEQGLIRLRSHLERGPIAAISRYTVVSARKP